MGELCTHRGTLTLGKEVNSLKGVPTPGPGATSTSEVPGGVDQHRVSGTRQLYPEPCLASVPTSEYSLTRPWLRFSGTGWGARQREQFHLPSKVTHTTILIGASPSCTAFPPASFPSRRILSPAEARTPRAPCAEPTGLPQLPTLALGKPRLGAV